jgi:hypothetical protein
MGCVLERALQEHLASGFLGTLRSKLRESGGSKCRGEEIASLHRGFLAQLGQFELLGADARQGGNGGKQFRLPAVHGLRGGLV